MVGVIEIINKRNQDRFTIEDEKTMKVLSLVFSSVFHKYNPISETSQIRRFSRPFNRKHAIIGKTAHINSLRSTIIKVKDLESSVLIHGEKGVGKLSLLKFFTTKDNADSNLLNLSIALKRIKTCYPFLFGAIKTNRVS